MKRWTLRLLMPLCLAPVAVSLGAAETSPPDESQMAESRTVEGTDGEAGRAQEPAAREGAQRASGGIFSSLIEFFRGKDPETPPEQEGEAQPGAQAGPERDPAPDDTPALPPQPAADPDERQSPDEEEIEEDTSSTEAREPARAGTDAELREEEIEGEVSADHVYQATLDLLREIEVLREAQGVAGEPGEPEARADPTPLDTYIEAREVMEKTARVQRRLGMIPVEAAPVPVKEITSLDLLRHVRTILEELRRVKRQLVVRRAIQPAPLSEGVAAPLVFRNLEYASSLLDGLVGRTTTSNDVYMHVRLVRDEMALIGAHLGVGPASEAPETEGNREPREVAEQVLRAVYKTINLQFRLGMEASSVPNVALEHVTPADVFDTTNILLGELVRIKVHMDIQSLPDGRPYSQKMQASDAFTEVLLVLANLEAITKAANESEGRSP